MFTKLKGTPQVDYITMRQSQYHRGMHNPGDIQELSKYLHLHTWLVEYWAGENGTVVHVHFLHGQLHKNLTFIFQDFVSIFKDLIRMLKVVNTLFPTICFRAITSSI